MVNGEENTSGRLKWRINIPDATSKVLEPEFSLIRKHWSQLKGLLLRFRKKVQKFFTKSWQIGVDEPTKFIHCLKVALALSLVSLFYYMKPLYDGVGGNAMWAVMTVVVVFEYTIGATLCKCINRTIATIIGGSLGLGIHWIASLAGERGEPIVLAAGVFIFAAAATFSRFIPYVKARFDYGALIFILTFSLVTVSGYRVDKLFMMAHQRMSTIAIGTFLCILVTMFFCPVWAGDKLHSQTIKNLENLANSLEGCVAEYFKSKEISAANVEVYKQLHGYRCVLASKATEESMAGFARWEPAHRRFNFGHPWSQYLKIGAAARKCAYCIDSLSSCINLELQAPEFLKRLIREECMKMSLCCAEVLKELAMAIKLKKKSSKMKFSKKEMNLAVQELHDALKSVPDHLAPPPSLQPTLADFLCADCEQKAKPIKAYLIEAMPLATVVTLLTETGARIEEIVDTVDKLATLADFKTETDNNQSKQKQMDIGKISPSDQDMEP